MLHVGGLGPQGIGSQGVSTTWPSKVITQNNWPMLRLRPLLSVPWRSNNGPCTPCFATKTSMLGILAVQEDL